MRHRPTTKPVTRGDFGALVLATATALLYAAVYGNKAVVRALLERGADPRVPLTHISRSGHLALKTSCA
jgi:hypothetical protein